MLHASFRAPVPCSLQLYIMVFHLVNLECSPPPCVLWGRGGGGGGGGGNTPGNLDVAKVHLQMQLFNINWYVALSHNEKQVHIYFNPYVHTILVVNEAFMNE